MQAQSKYQEYCCCFGVNWQVDIKIYKEMQRANIRQGDTKEYQKLEDFQHPISRLFFYKVTIIKMALYWHKNRQINQWNWIQTPETVTYAQTPDVWQSQHCSAVCVCGEMAFSINYQLNTCTEKNDPIPHPTTHTLNSGWVADLNEKGKTKRLLEENITVALEYTKISQDTKSTNNF